MVKPSGRQFGGITPMAVGAGSALSAWSAKIDRHRRPSGTRGGTRTRISGRAVCRRPPCCHYTTRMMVGDGTAESNGQPLGSARGRSAVVKARAHYAVASSVAPMMECLHYTPGRRGSGVRGGGAATPLSSLPARRPTIEAGLVTRRHFLAADRAGLNHPRAPQVGAAEEVALFIGQVQTVHLSSLARHG